VGCPCWVGCRAAVLIARTWANECFEPKRLDFWIAVTRARQ
jgi:hypothetical protein